MKVFLIFVIVTIGQTSLNAQIVSGKLIDENKKPMAYVNIGVIGLNRGAISSKKGLYNIDITGIDDEKIAKFSHVGYESVEFKIGELKKKHAESLNITLKKRIFKLQEVVIRPNNNQPVNIGAKRRGMMSWIWSEAISGAEIGTLIKNDKPVLLDKLLFHVRKNYCDSILYRVKIYDGKDKFPQEIINTEDIRFVSKKKKGWDCVDLSDYNIAVDGGFIIALETLESWSNDEFRTTHLSLSNVKKLSFSRTSSMAKWTVFLNEMSFKVKVKEYDH
ncbi:carboxypeptidase-like regulatory domain-containing protein [Maribacter sp. 2304DJ31-5]|uniref:carboxypeptidase-like regulatory domain-containing protein n=1 Tax=Maribacter sp. 2304DJ31-5 TaxID=3386273 RepID=UPI0039BC5577